jgi:acyl-CoA thioesterase-1
MSLMLRSGETILFIGDSITDCGRRGADRPLGNGYVKLFADLLTIREPAKHINIINKGIGGNKVTDLHARWTDDVLRHKPDWLSIKIGINDLHSGLTDPTNGVTPERFESHYDDILSRTRKALPECRILLIDPFYISQERSPNSWRKTVLDTIPAYIRIVHAMSRKYRTRLVKTHEIFQNLLKHHEADTFCPEPVHPNLTGHLAIAMAVYAALSR